jgi:hypothetical protein
MNKQITQLKIEDIQDVVGGVQAMAVAASVSYSPYATLYPQPVVAKQPVAPVPSPAWNAPH